MGSHRLTYFQLTAENYNWWWRLGVNMEEVDVMWVSELEQNWSTVMVTPCYPQLRAQSHLEFGSFLGIST